MRARAIGLALALLAGALPLAFAVTVASAPFWAWVEARFGIEAYGHSGPAAWCYWTVYGGLAGAGLALAWRGRRAR